MNKRIGSIGTTCMAIALSLACSTSGAQDLGKLGSMLGGGTGSMTSGSMGNVAGLLQYCVKNNYLGGSSGAAGIQNQLMGKLGGGSNSSSNSSGSSTSDMLKAKLKINYHGLKQSFTTENTNTPRCSSGPDAGWW